MEGGVNDFKFDKHKRPVILGVDRLFNYTAYLETIQRTLDIYGQPAQIIKVYNPRDYGYEDGTNSTLVDGYYENMPEKAYEWEEVKCWIDFNPKRGVFYHFNWFPDDMNELLICYLSIPAKVTEFNYIRTSLGEQVSIWGDNLYSIQAIRDDGKFQTLLRTYFIKPVSSSELNSQLKGLFNPIVPKVERDVGSEIP